MLDFATTNDFPRLVQLWKEGFQDDPDFVEQYLNTFAGPNNVFVYRTDDVIASAAYCMESIIRVNHTDYKAWYIYAVATAEACRGRGYSSQILARIKEYAKTQHVQALFLTPGNEGLRRFYNKAGFENAFYCSEFQISRKDAGTPEHCHDVALSDSPDIKAMALLRDRFYKDNYVKWDLKHIAYALERPAYPEITKGIYVQSELTGYVYGYIKDKCLFLPEICAEERILTNVFQVLLTQYDVQEIVYSRPYMQKGCKKSKGMLYLTDNFIDSSWFESVYLGLNLE